MSNGDATHDEAGAAGGPMIRLNFREFVLAPEFAQMKDAPLGEFETCDTISSDAVALERRGLQPWLPNNFLNTEFASLDEFKNSLARNELLFFHIFEKHPNNRVLQMLSQCADNERVLLLDVANDTGFLKNTPITVDITADRRIISRPLAELRGLGAWAKGTLFGFEDNEAEIGSFVSRARAFAHPAA
jgi:hypothetical protein